MSETKVDNLPRKVVGDILDYVDSSERQKLRRVSKFWDRNINNLYGAILTVNNANSEFILDSSARRIKAYFQSLTLPIPMNDNGIHFLNRLTSLTFSGLVVCCNIFPVFEECILVRKLDLILFNINPQMKEYQLSKDDPSKLLPALRALSIKFDYEPFNESNFTFLKNLLPFFTSEKGKLDSITLDCPDEGGPLEITFDKIFKKNSFQQQQKDATERPFVQTIPDEFYSELIISNFQTLRNLELADGKHQTRINMKIIGKTLTGSSEIQFSEFEQRLYSLFKLNNYFKDFLSTESITLFELLKPQNHLTKLSIVILPTFTLDQVYLITDNNFGTLKCLVIYYGQIYGHGLDASYLSKLAVLKVFKFLNIFSKHPPGEILYGIENPFGRIINMHSLPTSLRVFSTSASLQFEQEDDFNMTVFERLKNLKTFELTALPFIQIGKKRIYNMDAIKIRQLIACIPSLTKLVLRNNRPAVPYIHENQEYFDFMNKTDSLPNAALDWIDNETCINVQKIPIEFGGPITYGNPNLIGQHCEWNWTRMDTTEDYEPEDNEFPIRFDANILVDSDFPQRSTLLD